MNYTELDKRHKNGCKRFIDLWKEITDNHKCIKIVDLSDETDLYTLEFNEAVTGDNYVSLIDDGVTLYFPLMTISDGSKINFDDEILETNLMKLFSLLNNKKNFKLL